MQSFLAKCTALGIVAGGFTLTGDLTRLADRGRQLLDARTVPSDTPPADQTVDEPARASVSESTRTVEPTAASQPASVVPASPTPAPPPARPFLLDAPIGRAVAVPPPPAKGPESVDLRQVAAGSRLLVWVRKPGHGVRGRAVDLIALDLIDPKTGEALEHRHADLTHGSAGTAVHATPRRVVITRDANGRIVKGGPLQLAPLHGLNGLGVEEQLGTVLGLELPGR